MGDRAAYSESGFGRIAAKPLEGAASSRAPQHDSGVWRTRQILKRFETARSFVKDLLFSLFVTSPGILLIPGVSSYVCRDPCRVID